jgi:hypothetical protein
MIIIWDNGRGYSMHQIYFLDVPENRVTGVVTALDKYAAYCSYDTPKVLAVVPVIEWRTGAAMPIDKFATEEVYMLHHPGPGAEECKGDYGDIARCTCWVRDMMIAAGVWK